MDEKLQTIMGKVFNLPADQITADSSMQTIAAWDSLKHMELVVAVEEGYGVKLTADEIIGMTSVENITNTLAAKQ